MAAYTKFYLLNEVAPFTPTAWQGGWNQTHAAVTAFMISGEKEGNGPNFEAAVTGSSGGTNPWRVGHWRGVSQPLAGQLISGTVNPLIGVREQDATRDCAYRLHLYITVGSTNAVRGSLLTYEAPGADEWPIVSTGKRFSAAQPLTGFLCEDGDRLVMEVGLIGRNAAVNSTGGVRVGATTGGTFETALADLTDGSTLTSTRAGYLEFSTPLQMIDPPANDACSAAFPIEATPFSQTIDIRTATRAADDLPTTCNTDKYHTVWWSWTPISNSNATILAEVPDLNNTFTIQVSVWTGACGALTLVDCAWADEAREQELVFIPTIGVPYLIRVSLTAYNAEGTLTLSLTQIGGGSALANATCSTATAIGALPYSITGVDTSVDVTTDPADPVPLAGGTPHKTAWWMHTAAASVWHRIHITGTDYVGAVSVWTGACGSQTEVASVAGDTVGTDPQEEVFFLATMGTVYYVMVGAVNSDGGTLNLFVSLENPPGLGGPGATPIYEGAMGITSTFGRGDANANYTFPSADALPGGGFPILAVYQSGAYLIQLCISPPLNWFGPNGGAQFFDSLCVIYHDPVTPTLDGSKTSTVLMQGALKMGLTQDNGDYAEPALQTVEMRWRLSSRSNFSGAYNNDGFIEVRVDSVVIGLFENLYLAYPVPFAPTWSAASFMPTNGRSKTGGVAAASPGGADRVYLKDRAEYGVDFSGAGDVCTDADLVITPLTNRTPGVPVADGFNDYTDYDAPPSIWTRFGFIWQAFMDLTRLTNLAGIGIGATPGMTSSSAVNGNGYFQFDCFAGIYIGDLEPSAVTNCPPGTVLVITPPTLENGIVGVAYNQQLTGSGGTAPYIFTLPSGALPAGMALTSAGLISGTPSVATVAPVSILMTDANGCTADLITLTVLASPPPPCPTITLTPETIPAMVVGVPYSQLITASGGTAPYVFTLVNGVLPTGITLSSGGLLSGTPLTTPHGLITIGVVDANDCPGEIVYSLTGGPTDTVCPPQDGFTTPVTTATNCVAPIFP